MENLPLLGFAAVDSHSYRLEAKFLMFPENVMLWSFKRYSLQFFTIPLAQFCQLTLMWKVGKSWDKECQGFVSAVLDGNGRGYSSSGRHGFQIRPKDQDLCDKDAADRIKQSFKELSGKDAE